MAEVLLTLALSAIVSAQQGKTQLGRPPALDETLIIGRTTLKLGMARQYVVGALGSQFALIAVPNRAMADGGYMVRADSKPDADLLGEVYFDEKGTLEHAAKHLTPDTKRHYSDGEIGRVLFSLIGTLPNGGACSFMTVLDGATDNKFQSRTAYIDCGRKRYRFTTLTVHGDDSLDILEEIDVQTALQKEHVVLGEPISEKPR